MGNRVEFSEECRESIIKVRDMVEALPQLHHPNTDFPEEVYLACGLEAFSVSIHQVNLEKKRETLLFWSKKWDNYVTSCSLSARTSYCIHEVLRAHRAIFQHYLV